MKYAIFHSTARDTGYPGYPEKSGHRVTIVRTVSDEECDKDEVGEMYRIRFDDGVETDAFSDELTM